MVFITHRVKNKHGGLDSRDQSRSRLRTSFVLRLTFENRRECPSCQDQFFFCSRPRFFKSRLGYVKIFIKTVKIFKICWDFWDLLRLFEIYWDISTLSRLFEVLHHQKSWQIEKSQSRNRIKLTNSWSRSRKTVEICPKCHVSTYFSISIDTFETERWCRDKIEISQFSRPRFWKCRDFLDCWDQSFSRESRSRPHRDKSRPPCLVKKLFTAKIKIHIFCHRCN
jgi:hypothetical protein